MTNESRRPPASDDTLFHFAPPPADAAPEPLTLPYDDAPRFPFTAALFLAVMIIGCALAPLLANHDPAAFYTAHLNEAPSREFYFGTDALGRDLYSVLWYGGRLSLTIGGISTCVTTAIGILYGAISGLAPRRLDTLLMRTAEILSSIPSLLLMILLLSFVPVVTAPIMAVVIGVTTWMNLARIVRSEVVQIRNSDYVWAARFMGGGLWHILRFHLAPNFLSAVLFMIISSVGTAILMESTLSFLGIGLPPEVTSWGTVLSLATRALLTGSWWVILIPGLFLVGTLLAVTDIGYYVRRTVNRGCSNL